MTPILSAIAIYLLSGFTALLFSRRGEIASRVGAAGAVAGSAIGLFSALPALLGRGIADFMLPWPTLDGSFVIGLDALSALFLIPIFLVVALAAIYGESYLKQHDSKRPLGFCWLSFNVLAASMAMVVVARDGVLFLVAWEMMSISSFFLVTFRDESGRVRAAGWTYFVAMHIGTACLLACFMMMACGTADFEFANWAKLAGEDFYYAPAVFILALIGFGTKAGFMPMHVWLPEAHPAAPSHVSAVMSGVMIKTGIYGIARFICILGVPEAWWGWALIAIGACSGVMGVLCALAQHDIKSLLAYHSVENIGIIALGLGMGAVGVSTGSPAVAALGFGGALLHVVNHALFKGLLFLGAGSVIARAGTGAIDELGGLMKRMPRTGASFLVGSAAIAGLPPLNGFASEFLIFLSALVSIIASAKGGARLGGALPGIAVIAALALIGGLAQACFAKAFGSIFLGEPRTRGAADAYEAPGRMIAPMFFLACACAAIGLLSPYALPALCAAVSSLSGLPREAAMAGLTSAASPLFAIVAISAALIALASALLMLRRRMLSRREVRIVETWGCGYLAPTPRMQYTASSFAQPVVSFFRHLLMLKDEGGAPAGLFPDECGFSSHAGDLSRDGFFRPIFLRVARAASGLRLLQHGNVHLYILYIAIALLFLLLLWQMGGL